MLYLKNVSLIVDIACKFSLQMQGFKKIRLHLPGRVAGPVVEDAWAMEGRSKTEMGKIVLQRASICWLVQNISARSKVYNGRGRPP